MTRETKIGLLVGLAFIIVIGILLADYSSNSMQPPQASLGGTARNVQNSVVVPGARRTDPVQVQVDRVQVDRPVVLPPDPVVNGRTDVTVGPGTRTPRVIDARPPEVGPLAVPVQPTETPTVGSGASDSNPAAGSDTMAGMKQYKAEAGDTVSAMARKFMGSNTKANRDAIIKANPSLKGKPDKIVVGETYLIPINASINMDRQAGNDSSATETPAAPVKADKTKDKEKETKSVTYTTKPGDSLWKIAIEQCGSGQALAKIRELNKDVLKNGDAIKANMTLKLPKK